MNTAVVFTLNDRSGSRLISIFGNPNDYAWRLGNLSTYSTDSPVHIQYLTSNVSNSFHAVTVDSQTAKTYFSDKAKGILAYSLFIHNRDTSYKYYAAPPITKQVKFTAKTHQTVI